MIEVFKWIKGINKGNTDQILEISSQDRTRGKLEMGTSQKNLDSGQTQVDIDSLTEW